MVSHPSAVLRFPSSSLQSPASSLSLWPRAGSAIIRRWMEGPEREPLSQGGGMLSFLPDKSLEPLLGFHLANLGVR